MKRTLAILLGLVMLFIFSINVVQADIKEISSSDSKYIEDISKDKIIVGTVSEWNYREVKGRSYGYDSPFIDYLREELNLNVKVISVPVEKSLDILYKGKVDFLLGTPINEEVNKNTRYVDYKHLGSFLCVARKDSKITPQNINKSIIGALNGPITKNIISKRFKNIKYYNGRKEVLDAIEKKEVDLGLLEYHRRQELIGRENLKIVYNIDSLAFKLGAATTNKKYFKLVDIVNKDFNKFPTYSRIYEHNNINYKENLKLRFQEFLTKEEKEYIKKTKEVTLNTSYDIYPIFFREGSKEKGIVHEIGEMLEDFTGIKVLYSDNLNEKTDMKIDTSPLDIEEENKEKIYSSPLIMVGKQDGNRYEYFHSLPNYKVASLSRYKLDKINYYMKSNVIEYKNQDELLDAFNNSQIDYMIVDDDTFEYMVTKESKDNIRKINRIDAYIDFYVNLENSDKVLRSIMKKVIHTYLVESMGNSSDAQKIQGKFQDNYISIIDKTKEKYDLGIKVAIILMLICFLLIFLVAIANKRNSKIKRKLEYVLKKDPRIDVITIRLDTGEVTSDTQFRLLEDMDISNFSRYLKVINITEEEYRSIYEKARSTGKFEIEYSAYVDGLKKYFREYAQIESDGEVTSIVLDISDDINKRKTLNKKLNLDKLTGLYNRNCYENKIEELIKMDSDVYGALAFIDVNNFKYYNDTFGHNEGDRILIEIANILKSLVDGSTVVFRISGDEFGFYKHGISSDEELEKLKCMLSDKLTIEKYIGLKTVTVCCSIGVSLYNFHSRSIGELFKFADKAMYVSKKRKGEGSIVTILPSKYKGEVSLDLNNNI
ncbi:GGDEF domain-containing protein [Clostridium cylindrosporum]|uniref:GGDEF domain-containing protein n=1 Tax=Clostridium cylindrosporum DSM 605 TaxID=1121307 RepID=A0A0J8DF14_CLOCY|nr:GGDEF domain-containing protein [Clostridium cylindrosporum]KMT22854.1 hypothetical protein CLCY_5c00930 [Clostridium cylindrosporum DSM 605]